MNQKIMALIVRPRPKLAQHLSPIWQLQSELGK